MMLVVVVVMIVDVGRDVYKYRELKLKLWSTSTIFVLCGSRLIDAWLPSMALVIDD